MTEHLTASPCVMPHQTFIDFLLDESGSMLGCLNPTVAGFNNFVSDQAEQGGECYLTLTKFSTSVATPYENLDIALVPELSFSPQGGTSLFDSIGDRLERIIPLANSQIISLFVIMTDGDDTSSRRYNINTARELILNAQTSGVVVVYLGPSASALTVGAKLGIPDGNIKPFDTSNMAATLQTLNVATTAFRAGETTSKTFFA